MMKLLTSIAALLLSTHAFAVDSKEDTSVWGIGNISCGKYLAAWTNGNNDLKISALTWIQGYLTAVNTELVLNKQKPLKYTDPDTIDAYMQKFCRDNPLKELYIGAYRLTQERKQAP